MHHLNPTLASSDEGAESGEDSEEDLVTNYMGSSPVRNSYDNTSPGRKGPSHSPRHPLQLPIHSIISNSLRQQQHTHPHGMGVHPAHTHGQPRRLVRMAEIPTMDSVTGENGSVAGISSAGGYIPFVPRINIIPNTPTSAHRVTSLDQTLRQLRILQEQVQKMKEKTLHAKGDRKNLSRLSSSCPSLNVDDIDDEELLNWSQEFLLDARKFQGNSGYLDNSRRQSWAGPEDKNSNRHRAVSLSSLDSDVDESFYNDHNGRRSDARSRQNHRSLSGSSSPVTYGMGTAGSSTHSLNEEQGITEKPIADRPRLLTPRLTLQKSISTPSILVGNAVAQEQTKKQTNQTYDDETTSKRRKRGSIFFRRKKDKSKKPNHTFSSVCFNISRNCDCCSKSLTNKPALKCEACLVCVHDSACKDQINDCTKSKANKVQKSSSSSVPAAFTNKNVSNNQQKSSNRPFALHGPYSPSKPQVPTQSSRVNHDDTVDSSVQDSEHGMLENKSGSVESLEDALEGSVSSSTVDTIDSDPELGLLENEPEFWVSTVDKEITKNLTEKQVKKQEHIYELIITEKHHCRMLKVMKKLFAEGLRSELAFSDADVKRIFPCLDELITIHFSFLWRLRERQRIGRHIDCIGDLLLEQFVGDNSQGLKDAYGLFCSRHQDAVSYYKELLQKDRKFQSFIRTRSCHPLMQKKGLPECILFVTHRVTKYPLMIEAIMKYSKNQPAELETLKKALQQVKNILVNINAQVAEKESRQRLLEIYHKIDAKSSTSYRKTKIKKSDLFTDGRKLMFEGQAILNQQRGKSPLVSVIVMSDMIFFLQEVNNQKYYFVTPENKPGAIPLCKLLVREKAGDSRCLYLISGNQNEMFELECQHPKDKKIWFESIREAVDTCPEDEFGNDTRKSLETNAERIHELLVGMQHQDKELARVCEEKMKSVIELVDSLGGDALGALSSLGSISPSSSEIFYLESNYRAFLEEQNLSAQSATDLQLNALQTALRLVGSASGWGTNLARSVSSVGEHQSEAYVCPSLPKRAETFGGFDNPNKDNAIQLAKIPANIKKKKESKMNLLSTDQDSADPKQQRRLSGDSDNVSQSSESGSRGLMSLECGSQPHQQSHAAQLIQCLNTALVLSQHHVTQYHILRAKLETGSNAIGGRFSHSQKLEELRNIQENISLERKQWNREKEHQEKWISEKREELNKKQENLRTQEADIAKQRDELYRKLEALSSQGIILNPLLTVLTSNSPGQCGDATAVDSSPNLNAVSPMVSPTGFVQTRPRAEIKHRNSTASLSGFNRESSASLTQKGAVPAVKQKLPMKLAKLSSTGSSGTSSSSLSSSISSSLGGIMSPSLDKDIPPRGSTQANASNVQQMIPMKLSEALGSGSRQPVGYQRLPSPPLAEKKVIHHRTGSSPSNMLNGAQNQSREPKATNMIPTTLCSNISRPAPPPVPQSLRRNPIYNVSERPAGKSYHSSQVFISNQSHVITNSGQLRHDHLPDASSENLHSNNDQRINNRIVQNTGHSQHSGELGPPGRRVRDPDTNQDIIFF